MVREMKLFDLIPLILTFSRREKGLLNLMKLFRTILVGLNSNAALNGVPSLLPVGGR